jgi:hypothetical protein
LKLVAQVEPGQKIEALPDIDFNIRAGNTLVGFVTKDDVRKAIELAQHNQQNIVFGEQQKVLEEIEEQAENADRCFKQFQDMQTKYGMDHSKFLEAKAELRSRLKKLEKQLNDYLAREYGKNPKKETEYDKWLSTHKPFHWFIEFYGRMKQGGFDTVIGNPPYVEYKKVRKQYTIRGFVTERCGDLFAFVAERSVHLLRDSGRLGLIVPVSIASTDGFDDLRRTFRNSQSRIWATHFAERPSKLFEGVEKRLTVWISQVKSNCHKVWSSHYWRWLSEERPFIFPRIQYCAIDTGEFLVRTAIPKVHSPIEKRLLARIGNNKPLGEQFANRSSHVAYYTRKVRYFVQFFDFIPRITNEKRQIVEPSELKQLLFSNKKDWQIGLAVLNSNLFFWFFSTFSDVRNVNRREIELFPCSLEEVQDRIASDLGEKAEELMQDLRSNSLTTEGDYGDHGILKIQTFQPRLSKPIIDEIDCVLAQHYGFTDEELDFIINYDIKYRMGRDAGSTADEAG